MASTCLVFLYLCDFYVCFFAFCFKNQIWLLEWSKINQHLGYRLAAENKPSRVILLSKKKSGLKISK